DGSEGRAVRRGLNESGQLLRQSRRRGVICLVEHVKRVFFSSRLGTCNRLAVSRAECLSIGNRSSDGQVQCKGNGNRHHGFHTTNPFAGRVQNGKQRQLRNSAWLNHGVDAERATDLPYAARPQALESAQQTLLRHCRLALIRKISEENRSNEQ